MKAKWKTGDWCFSEFKLSQITRSKNGVPTEIRDGSFSRMGGDLSYGCVPLTLRNSSISQLATYWSDRLHREGHGGLNYPRIHDKLVDLWLAACNAPEAEQAAACCKIEEFAMGVLDHVRNAGEVMGVPLLRRK